MGISTTQIRVLVVDDQKIVRDAARRLLECDPDVRVIGEAADGIEAVGLALRLQPDVIVMDIRMPKMNGLEATSNIRELSPSICVILITALAIEAYSDISRICGASAFLSKEDLSAQLLTTVRRIVPVI